ncbi:recombinase family protein [Bradyrhizobium hipponense]|uniref:recombinase family protein n=1 Tax=Bradyrhizobium hipponense TaxID=2605638 RepID=UPI001F412C3E|nr:recombinase family protein [Bradyrhizobium hipponense]
MPYLDRNGLSLPVRPLLGPSPHKIVWRAPDSVRVLSILQNPAYAGAYVYGRRQKDPSRCPPGSLTGTVKVAIADWAVCLHPLTQAISAGRSSWPTRAWQIMSSAMRLDTLAHRARGQPCYKELQSAAVVDGA